MAKHERTLQMMESFISLHNEGHDINEIAKMFNLAFSTVYKHLGEIAEKNGVTRESLLEKVIVADHSGRNIEPLEPIDRKQFCSNYKEAIEAVEQLEKEIKKKADMVGEFLERE